MTEVSVIGGGNYNMYSLTIMMKAGRQMTGDRELIQLKKDGVVIKFDIMVPTTKGCIFHMYFTRNGEVQEESTMLGGRDEHRKSSPLAEPYGRRRDL